MSAPRNASTPINGAKQDLARTLTAVLAAYFVSQGVPPDAAAPAAGAALVVVSGVLAGLGKIARDRDWKILKAF